MLKKTFELTFVLVLMIFIAPAKVHAYLDPGSGSYLIQIIVASLASGGYFLKTNWKKIKQVVLKKNRKKIGEKEDK